MSGKPLICVIDANVALKLFFDQPLSEPADKLFAHLAENTGARFCVPDFFYAECASAFVNYTRFSKYPVADAKKDLEALRELNFNVIPTSDLAIDAFTIAVTHRLNGYDAFYVALAAQITAPLITADEKLVAAMKNKAFRVEWLGDFVIPPA